MMAGGVVSAANLWGTYKGNDIVKITFHGVDLKTIDAPAMNYESRTMIPIHMLGQIGLQYTWDHKNKTVDIKQNVSNSSASSTVSTIKHAVSYADYFHSLETLDHLIITNNELGMGAGQYTDDTISSIFENYNDAIRLYEETEDALEDYHLTKSQSSAEFYTTKIQLATRFSNDGKYLAAARYSLYIKNALSAK